MAVETLNDIELNVIDAQPQQATNPATLIWAHGLMFCTAADVESGLFAWKKTQQQHRVVRYDARGHGESQVTPDPADYQWQNLGRDMLAVAQHSGADKFVLGGASMGCGTSLMAALQLLNSEQKEKLAGLVLVIPPTGWKSRKLQTLKYRVLAWFSKLRLVPALLPQLTQNKVIAGFLHKSMAYTEAVLLRYMASHKKEAYFPILMGSAQSDMPSEDELKTIDVPVLILAWKDDASHPVSTATRLRELLPNSEIHLANETRHVDLWDQQIAEFLQRVAAC